MPASSPPHRRIISSLRYAIVVCLLGALAATVSFAQPATLRGTVADALSGEPLPGAHVLLSAPGFQTGTTTAVGGDFEFAALAAGLYTLSVSFVGYDPERLENISIESGETRSLPISLVPSNLHLNPLTVTASRGAPQKLLEAPSAISVLDARELETRTVLTAAEHLKTAPGVDLISTGIVQSRVVIRGFNDNLASSLLTLVDDRIAQVPSIRLTALQLIPIGNLDLDRIEVVSGPASALYGPNSANGVVHVLTKSPFESEGTVAGVGIGQKSIFTAGVSHTATRGDRFGYRVSAQYADGEDYAYFDPIELQARSEALIAGASADTLLIGARDFSVRTLSFSGRMDYRIAPAGTITVNSGVTRGNNIEVSPTGAVQIDDAYVAYLQARLTYRNLFAQAYLNALQAGNSFMLRTGMPFRERSRFWVAQVRHQYALGTRQSFTYGMDLFLTRPNSEGTVSRRFEDRDDINEVGAYVQSETALTPRLNLIAAGRIDHHNRIDHPTFSPRLALVHRIAPLSAVRLSFNRAYQTPGSDKLFADVLGLRDVFQSARLQPELGFAPSTDVWVQGSADGGFHFQRTTDGRLQFYSPFARLDPRGLADTDPIRLNDPTFTNVMWGVARQAALSSLPQGLADAGLLPPSDVLPVTEALARLLPVTLTGVDQVLQKLDLETQAFVPVSDVVDVDPLDITRYQTIELGYQGILGRRLLFGIDLYHTRVRNFIGPFQVATPNVFLDAATLRPYLLSSLENALSDPKNAADRIALNTLDQLIAIGNRNGSSADEIAWLVGETLASAIPFGTVSPEEAFEKGAVLLVRRNFGDISLQGIDTRFTFFVTRELTLSGGYSYLSRNFFEQVDGVDDVALNAPKHKFSSSLRYFEPAGRFEAEFRMRRVGAFPVRSDVYIGHVEAFTVFDVSATCKVPFSPGTRITITVQNVADNLHREFVNAPEIGRLGMMRILHQF